jgi:octopine/nopaline transport system permease protein
MNLEFYSEALMQMLGGVPLTLQLTVTSFVLGAILALLIATVRLSGISVLD